MGGGGRTADSMGLGGGVRVLGGGINHPIRLDVYIYIYIRRVYIYIYI